MCTAPDNIPQTLQDVPPKWAHFCLHIEQFIQNELGVDLNGKTVITAFSGGIDSTALLLVLHYLTQKNDGKLIAVHLNHLLRKEASKDAHWVQAVCNQLGIQCIVNEVDVNHIASESRIGIEEAGRIARYAFFAEELSSHSADYVAVGHHLDDLCEDVLMRLIRGTGWPSLSGMDGTDPKRNLIRPLLLTTKSQLANFLTELGIDWREDETNASPDWTRNRVRNDILPLFLKENPNFHESIARLWKIGKLDQDYWNLLSASATDDISNVILKDSHQALRLRLYKASLDKLGKGQALAETLFKLDKAWAENRIGSTFQFPGEKTVTITASGLVFSRSH